MNARKLMLFLVPFGCGAAPGVAAPPPATTAKPAALEQRRAEPAPTAPSALPAIEGPKSKAKRLFINALRACAILEDDTLACWGGKGESKPRRIAGFEQVVEVALGFGITAIRADGSVIHTGPELEAPRTLSKLSNVVDLEAAWPEQLCAIARDGGVWCYPEPPINRETGKENAPKRVAGVRDAHALAIGPDFGCAVVGAGKLGCWRLTAPLGKPNYRSLPVNGVKNAKSVWAGAGSVCVRRTDGSVACFDMSWQPKLRESSLRRSVVGVSLEAEDNPFVCGADGNAIECARIEQVGSGYSLPALEPGKLPSSELGPIVELGVAGNVGCARDERGQIGCWGYNRASRLARPDLAYIEKPTLVPGIPKAKQIALGEGFTCMLSEAEEVWCWGEMPAPRASKLGEPRPQRIAGLSKIARLFADTAYACAQTRSGETSCFMGVDWTNRPRTPVRVSALDGARAMLLPEMGVLGRVAAIGASGELLLGPTPGFGSLAGLKLSVVPGISNVRRLAGDQYVLVVLDSTGRVHRIAIQNGAAKDAPTAVAGLDGAVDLAGHAVLTKNGELAVWTFMSDPSSYQVVRKQTPVRELIRASAACGRNRGGDLVCLAGDQDRVLLEKMSNLPAFVDEHQCGIDPKGKLWCRGENRLGQAGVKVGIDSSKQPLIVALP